jgi:hypothetical protein
MATLAIEIDKGFMRKSFLKRRRALELCKPNKVFRGLFRRTTNVAGVFCSNQDEQIFRNIIARIPNYRKFERMNGAACAA